MSDATLARGSAGKRRHCYFVQLWRKCCASSCARASPSSRCASCSSWASLASGSRRFHRAFLFHLAARSANISKQKIHDPETRISKRRCRTAGQRRLLAKNFTVLQRAPGWTPTLLKEDPKKIQLPIYSGNQLHEKVCKLRNSGGCWEPGFFFCIWVKKL